MTKLHMSGGFIFVANVSLSVGRTADKPTQYDFAQTTRRALGSPVKTQRPD